MRLGQLARKIEITPAQVLDFLRTQNIAIDAGANTRLEDEHVRLILNHFAAGTVLQAGPTDIDEPKADADQAEQSTTGEEGGAADAPPTEPELPQPIEVIKPPKIELQGLKVVGKIELPDPKKKGVDEQKDEPSGDRGDRVQRRSTSFQKPDKRDQWKRQQERARSREVQDQERRLEDEEKKAKERRTLNYLKKVKSVPTKPARLFEDPVIEMPFEAERPKTLWGRFYRWLTT